MLDHDKVNAFIEESQKKIKELDAVYEQNYRLLKQNEHLFRSSPEIKAKARELLEEARAKAAEDGRAAVKAYDISTNNTKRTSFSRRRNMI